MRAPETQSSMRFAVSSIQALTIESESPLREMYKLSPFVWREDDGYHILIRAVPHSENAAEKIARIHYGRSQNGIMFTMENEPVIAPGPNDVDLDGCEDPSVAIADGTYYVYYSGWNEREKQGQLLLASGPSPRELQKCGVALPATPHCKNPKEATIASAPDGSWRLFFEYADNGASLIGVADAPSPAGPWSVQRAPFDPRADSWDNFHLSTGPICSGSDDSSVMFYNGAGRDADWRIGWIAFDRNYRRVIARSIDPLIAPPAKRQGDARDIAFAASALEEDGSIRLYYSIADQDMYCATLRRL